jgi:hypothetical protein
MTDPRDDRDPTGDPPEPTGYTADGTPWEEARGPHLPDPMTRTAASVPLLAWLFLVIAVLLALSSIADRSLSPSGIAGGAMDAIRAAAPALFGAGLFFRHPRAVRTDPQLVFGIVLLGVAGGWSILQRWLGPELLYSADDFSPTPFALGLFTLAVSLGLFGIGYIALGLADARAYEDAPGTSRGTRMIILVVALSIVTELALGARSFVQGGVESGGLTLAANLIALAYQVLLLAAWGFLAATALVGARSSERPTRAWRSAALGALLVLAYHVLYAVASVWFTAFPVTDGNADVLNIAFWGLSAIQTLGYLALIAAFFLGLPGVDETEPETDGDDLEPEDLATTEAAVAEPAVG